MADLSQEMADRPVGSFGIWLWVRVVEGFALAWCLGAAKLGFLLDALIFLMLMLMVYEFNPAAYGRVSARGIVFRQYLRKHFVPWTGVEAINWERGSASLEIRLKQAPRWRQSLSFATNPSVREYLSQLLGRARPDLVDWMQQRVNSAKPTVPGQEDSHLPGT